MTLLKSALMVPVLSLLLGAPLLAQDGQPHPAGRAFGLAAGGETSGEHATIFPLVRQAGITTVRIFPEWPVFQPGPGEWNFREGDRLIASARRNDIEIAGMLFYLAPFASSAGDSKDHGIRTRTFPVKDMQYWRDYVGGVVGRYKDDVTYWEVYNEFNSTAFARNGTVEDYVKLVRDAYTSAKTANPKAKIGIGCADVDLSFLEQVITGGASGHFDFINCHPYSMLDAAMRGNETIFLRLGDNIRKLLARTNQPNDIEIWVSEIGRSAHNEPTSEQEQAVALVKAYSMLLAMDIQRVYWFEAKGPPYGKGGDFGLFRDDWSERPSYHALRTTTRLIGDSGTFAGWSDPNSGKSYGFVFEGREKPVLVAWAAGSEGDTLRFTSDVTVHDILGDSVPIKAGEDLKLTREPLFVTDLPVEVISAARATAGKPFPWLKDYAKAESVSITMGTSNVESGILQLDKGDGVTSVELVDGSHVRRTGKAKNRNYMYFDVDDSYASLGDRELEIALTVKRADPAKDTRFSLSYEGQKKYVNTRETLVVPGDGQWHEMKFKVNDANFANSWGWNFRIDISGSAGDVLVKQVHVRRVGERK